MRFFTNDNRVGVFKGFREGGLEFHADLVLPYKSEFQSIPMIGQFVLIQLEHENEAVLGRIASMSSDGKLTSGSGEEFNLRAMEEGREIPEELREQYLKYRVDIRVLGVVRMDASGQSLTFVASHRRLPHVGSPVAFPTDEILKELAGANIDGAAIGFFSLGEFIYAADSDKLEAMEWMQVKEPEVLIRFPMSSLISRRSFVFARAGFGKSNLNKLLFSELYRQTPHIQKRGGKEKPVGTIIFDPDGEYFWPDDKGRPGLCDVAHLQEKLVVFTNREAPSGYYDSFVAGRVRLDLREFRPVDVITLTLPVEKQEQQNVLKLKGLKKTAWRRLVELIDTKGYRATNEEIREVLGIPDVQEVEINAIKSNMTKIVHTLHDRNNRLFDTLKTALEDGKLCIIDISQMRGKTALMLAGLILRKFFNYNSIEFTKKDSRSIPILMVMEEAQSVLNDKEAAAEPFVEWVKEGRKYDLGAFLITQQPGSISSEILSQGDNWFIMHLLSAGDLRVVQNANAHFSGDILSVLLNEAIPGQGVMWSSVGGKPYPVSLRVLSFENLYEVYDPAYEKPSADIYAKRLRQKLTQGLDKDELKWQIVQSIKADTRLYNALLEAAASDRGVSWGEVMGAIIKNIPSGIFENEDEKSRFAFEHTETIFGHLCNDAHFVKDKVDGKMRFFVGDTFSEAAKK